jgi:tellurium resistance protein TerD
MYVRLIDQSTQQEVVRFILEDKFTTETAIITSQLSRVDGRWNFLALGNGVDGGLQA